MNKEKMKWEKNEDMRDYNKRSVNHVTGIPSLTRRRKRVQLKNTFVEIMIKKSPNLVEKLKQTQEDE